MTMRNKTAAALLRRHLGVLKIGTGAMAIAVASSFAVPAVAQETTSSMTGLVLLPSGDAANGAMVEIVHTPSGTRSVATVNAEGRFTATGLRVGGPYNVTFRAAGLPAQVVEGVFIRLGEPAALDLVLEGGGQQQAMEEIVVTGERIAANVIGSGSQFSEEVIRRAPTINRDLKDVARFDPKVFIDVGDDRGVEPISIAGANSRFNSLTVDGVRQSDDFGLRDTGYPTNRPSISFDAVEQLAINVAPFDVEYSGFQGGNINVVTKSGTNDFSGTAFFYYTSDELTGDKSKDREVDVQNFKEETYGATLGGPIIQDKLFFFLSYEKFETANLVSECPIDVGCLNPQSFLTSAVYQQIRDRSIAAYGYDPGSFTDTGLPEEDEKYLAKIDWNINDQHRASFTYQRAEGTIVSQTSGSTIVNANNGSTSGATSRNTISAPGNWYNSIDKMDVYTAQLFSDWTDNFSTEIKFGRKENSADVPPIGGLGIGEASICINSAAAIADCRWVTIGPDQFRHANILTNDLNTYKVKGTYLLGDHTISAGWEREDLEIFNQFVDGSRGLYRFDSLNAFLNGNADRIFYRNAFTNNPDDGAADFGYGIDAFYLQDKWDVTADLTLTAGLRYERFTTDDAPRYNAAFERRFGFRNDETLDGRDLWAPRIGFNYNLGDRTTVRGGFGLFGGGSPNVWISNSYTNDGIGIVQTEIFRSQAGAPAILNGVDIRNVPAAVQARLAEGDGEVNAIDPDFDIPSSWRYNLAVDHQFDLGALGDGWNVTAEVLYTDVQDALYWENIGIEVSGQAPDGRPLYRRIVDPVTNRNVPDAYILRNTSEGSSLILSASVSNDWETDYGDLSWFGAYAYQDVKEVNPGTSSRAVSNLTNLAFSDINNPENATSNYEIKHRFTMAGSWSKAFFGDSETSISFFWESRSGRPYSYVMNLSGQPQGGNRQLLYVPTGPNDPLVNFGAAGSVTWEALSAYIQEQGLDKYAGGIAPRNAFNSDWVHQLDVKLAQEVPTFFDGHKAVVEVDFRNFLNLLDSDWGRIQQIGFPYTVTAVNSAVQNGRYVYTSLSPTVTEGVNEFRSLWQIRLGLRYEF